MALKDPFGTRGTLETSSGPIAMFRLGRLEQAGLAELDKVPMTVKILLENVLRMAATGFASENDVSFLAH